MTTKSTVFDECTTVFGFPGYFGRNWDAVEECIGDFLAGRADNPVPVVVSHAALLLTDAPDDEFTILIDILASAGESGRSRLAVTLADDEPGVARIQERLRRNGVRFTAG
jgi:RNAse (barnase) inhibitor barstar